jgi:hypothetical protein
MSLLRSSLVGSLLVLAGSAPLCAQMVVVSPPPKVSREAFALWSRPPDSNERRSNAAGRLNRQDYDVTFITPQGRSDQQIAKHMSVIDTLVLNRLVLPFVGISNAARAAQAEEQEQWNRYVSETNERIALIQQFDREHARRLRSEFYETAYRRTRTAQW